MGTSATTNMNTFLFFSSLIAFSRAATVAVAPAVAAVNAAPLAAAPYLVRAPAHDSASIEHHRLGGNFAYSTAEAHAFASVTPQISTFGTQEISGPVRTHQTVHQPLVHETRTHTVQEVSQAFATPLAQNVGVPVSVEQTHVAHGVAHVPTTVPVAGHAVVGHAVVGHAGYAGIAPVAGYAGYAGHPVAVAAH